MPEKKKWLLMSDEPNNLQQLVRERFSKLANEPLNEKRVPIGVESAKTLGYDPEEIDRLPISVVESFAGVGNPLSLSTLQLGQAVLDLGSGAGLDSILAARLVGSTGKVLGVDMTEAMIKKARNNAEVLQLSNVEFYQADIETLPIGDNSMDVVVSNGVFNLCPNKTQALAETFRVLRCGGKLAMADILLEPHVTEEEVSRLGSWSD
jgi:arsenite methyltransferase